MSMVDPEGRGLPLNMRHVARQISSATAPITPSDVASLVAWYDFSDASTLFTDTGRTTAVSADGQTIKGISDKSASAAHGSDAVGCTYKTAIQNSKSVGRFAAASSNKLTLGTNVAAFNALTGNLTIFAVVQVSATAAFHEIIAYDTDAAAVNAFEFRLSNGGATPTLQFEDADGALFDSVAATATTNNAWHQHAIVRVVATSASFFTDGTAKGTPALTKTPTTNASSVGYLGAARNAGAAVFPFDGDIAEILIYNSALSATNRAQVESYLRTKWGTP